MFTVMVDLWVTELMRVCHFPRKWDCGAAAAKAVARRMTADLENRIRLDPTLYQTPVPVIPIWSIGGNIAITLKTLQ
jgi:hypothetical protein